MPFEGFLVHIPLGERDQRGDAHALEQRKIVVDVVHHAGHGSTCQHAGDNPEKACGAARRSGRGHYGRRGLLVQRGHGTGQHGG
ncbi:hypothetical protein SDC9_83742 [bioreactor metagenome]|uniref:Uncharacterized protein n=1 Tax=bioreactor metagenome TaxID=1076179 RepID=A0A644Z8D3_9ZZZZ